VRERAVGSDADGPSPGAGSGELTRPTSRFSAESETRREGRETRHGPGHARTRRNVAVPSATGIRNAASGCRQDSGKSGAKASAIVLERATAGGERIGTALSALDRIFRRSIGARTECKVAARCGKIAIGLFECGHAFRRAPAVQTTRRSTPLRCACRCVACRCAIDTRARKGMAAIRTGLSRSCRNARQPAFGSRADRCRKIRSNALSAVPMRSPPARRAQALCRRFWPALPES